MISNSLSNIRVAVIGCGYWGPNHIRNFLSLDGCDVVAVDTDASKLARVKREFPQAHTCDSVQKIFEDSSIDAVVIATPSNTHFEITRDALKSGKHVLCEKPLCMCVQEASELSQLANELGLVLMTGHVFLFNAGIEKIKQIIDNDELGSIRYLSSIRTNLGPIRSDVNAAFDLATHDISIFNWLIGMEPKTVVASGGDFVRRGIHDVVFINLQYPNGQIASVHASWLNPKKVRQMTIVGAERMATWDDLNFGNPVAIYESGANATEEYSSFGEFLQVSMWDGDVRMPKISHREPLKSQAQYFVDGIVAGVVHKSNSDFSLGIIRVLDAIQYSLKNGGVRTEIGINTPLNN